MWFAFRGKVKSMELRVLHSYYFIISTWLISSGCLSKVISSVFKCLLYNSIHLYSLFALTSNIIYFFNIIATVVCIHIRLHVLWKPANGCYIKSTQQNTDLFGIYLFYRKVHTYTNTTAWGESFLELYVVHCWLGVKKTIERGHLSLTTSNKSCTISRIVLMCFHTTQEETLLANMVLTLLYIHVCARYRNDFYMRRVFYMGPRSSSLQK